MDRRPSLLNHSKQDMCYKSSSQDLILSSVMIVGSKIICTSLEHYNTWIISNVFTFFGHICYFRCTSIIIWYTLQTPNAADCTARYPWAISGGIRLISILIERQLCQLFVYPTGHIWPIFQATSMPGHNISWLEIFENKSSSHLKITPGFMLGYTMSLERCQRYWHGMAFYGWNTAVPNEESWHNWPRPANELCWWILEIMLLSFSFLGWGWSRISHNCSSFISLLPDVSNSERCADGALTHWPLHNPSEQHVYLELLDETNIDVLHPLGVYPIRNMFWQYSLSSVCCYWQPAEFHQPLLDLVKGLLHWLLQFLKAGNVKDHFDSRFTSEPQYPGVELFSKQFNSLNSGSLHRKDIRRMI